MQTILVPTDFSEQAGTAAKYAASLAKELNARLFLFHAYMLPTPVSEVPYVMVTVDDLQHENENIIKKEAEFLNQQFGVEIEWLVRIGIPSDEIKVLTEEKNFDLIVMGMKGVGGLDKIIGSTTTNAIRKVRNPVLIIPQNSDFEPLKTIVYATDLHYEIPINAYQPLITLSKHFQARINIVTVTRSNTPAKTDALEWRNSFEPYLQGIEHDFSSVTDTSVSHGITGFLDKHPGEMLVMVAHKHTFLERLFSKSKTTEMAYETRIPLLILHERA